MIEAHSLLLRFSDGLLPKVVYGMIKAAAKEELHAFTAEEFPEAPKVRHVIAEGLMSGVFLCQSTSTCSLPIC